MLVSDRKLVYFCRGGGGELVPGAGELLWRVTGGVRGLESVTLLIDQSVLPDGSRSVDNPQIIEFEDVSMTV